MGTFNCTKNPILHLLECFFVTFFKSYINRFFKKNFSTFMEKSKPFPDELIHLCGSYIIDNATGIIGTLQMDAEVT